MRGEGWVDIKHTGCVESVPDDAFADTFAGFRPCCGQMVLCDREDLPPLETPVECPCGATLILYENESGTITMEEVS